MIPWWFEWSEVVFSGLVSFVGDTLLVSFAIEKSIAGA
ncbi:hypothetical protein EV13_0051 [Prochlorococcus sp. MIT 0702]|nr:hypothetical protein EV13_0051 [Prochlorococcus sp. MIT 0702]KGG34865.1 hypothetical protein EV14_1062 [Prochlorococcus sp. MIT 0703]